MTTVVFEDAQAYADLGTFVARAKAVDPEGAIHLQADGTLLAARVGVLPGRGLLGDGTVTGLRAMTLGQPATFDTIVSLASLSDRITRHQDPTWTLALPPTSVAAVWASLAPGRGGWERVGELPQAVLEQAARAGIEEVARASAATAGAPAVARLRQSVWGRLTDTVPPVPAGAAFAAYVLGFLEPDGTARVFTQGRWVRLATRRGQVLVR